jgi:uncharacterized membrane protein YhaH (DUF805 family)
MKWYLSSLRYNYATFSGRARRSEYWYFMLFNVLIIIALFALNEFSEYFGIVFALYVLAIILPSLAVTARRLHDMGKSGTYFFIRFVPFVGDILLLVALCTPGDTGRNKYGADPKLNYDELDEIGQPEKY